MCSDYRLLNATTNGVIYWFEHFEMAQVVFKNLCFDFNPNEYNSFLKYLSTLDAEYLEKKHKSSVHSRKIAIPMGNSCFTILLNKEELFELKHLFLGKRKFHLLNNPVAEIGYEMMLN